MIENRNPPRLGDRGVEIFSSNLNNRGEKPLDYGVPNKAKLTHASADSLLGS
jgi:hypothetical protein